jgi:hypothetical protein
MEKPTRESPAYVRGVGHVFVDTDVIGVGYVETTDGRTLGRIVKAHTGPLLRPEVVTRFEAARGLGGVECKRVRAMLRNAGVVT